MEEITVERLAALLTTAEQAHATSGHSAEGWQEWYAAFILQSHRVLEKPHGGYNA